MIWILIWTLNNPGLLGDTSTTGTQTFKTQSECEAAGKALQDTYGVGAFGYIPLKYTCIEKTDE